ncbi:hypothetical protein BC833DRAFT_611555 [Globomyces pollinis-pini]|nr:hypothetical protein BC833DRAFT_611555 [Globomyces pollinis-pini]
MSIIATSSASNVDLDHIDWTISKSRTSPVDFLSNNPPSAYSAARFYQGRFQFKCLHISRVIESLKLLSMEPLDTCMHNLELLLDYTVQKAIEQLQGDDFAITFLTTKNGDDWLYAVLCQSFIQPDMKPCNVVAYGHPRINPNAKYSQWIKDRSYIEQIRPPDTTEMILFHENQFYEGLVTNFFAIIIDADNVPCVITAPFDKVLVGIMASVVVKVCEIHNIRFRFQHPANPISWNGCFLTNVYRSVQPIKKLSIYQQSHLVFDFQESKTLSDLKIWVSQYIQNHS